MMAIPKNMFQTWIGPRPAPLEWMQKWQDVHPNWNYTLVDNDYVSSRTFRNQKLIDEYMLRAEYAAAADLIRYEVLFENGGYMPGADSLCLRPTDELWTKSTAYTVYENEFMRGQLVAPIMACNPENEFVKALIDRLSEKEPHQLDKAWRTTGNYFVTCMIEELEPEITIFPSHYFIPEHFTGRRYVGDGPIYARQLFGETVGGYQKPSFSGRLKMLRGRIRSWNARRSKNG